MTNPHSEEELILEESFSSDEELDEVADIESNSDVDAKLAEDDVFDIEFFKCYLALKKKDGKIYDKNVKFFSEEVSSDNEKNDDVHKDEEKRDRPKMTLLDHQLNIREYEIEDLEMKRQPKSDLNEPVSKSFYEKELEEIKKSIEKVGENIDSDDELLVVKGSQAGLSKPGKVIGKLLDKLEDEEEEEDSYLKQIWNDLDKLTEDEKFLRDYILNKRYIPANQDDDDDGSNNKGGFFSKNLDDISDVEEGHEKIRVEKHKFDHHSGEKDFEKISRIPRNSTKTIRDLVEKRDKKERRMKNLEKVRRKKKALKDADYEDLVGDLPTKFHYIETEPNDFGLSAEELLMAPDEELDKWIGLKHSGAKQTKSKKKKHKRGLSHKKFAQSGVAPDRLLAYGLSKTRLKKSKLL